jgi:hypothetical protein
MGDLLLRSQLTGVRIWPFDEDQALAAPIGLMQLNMDAANWA